MSKVYIDEWKHISEILKQLARKQHPAMRKKIRKIGSSISKCNQIIRDRLERSIVENADIWRELAKY